MSANKRHSLATGIYERHMQGRFNRNSRIEREARIVRMYQRILTELAANRFKWEGLPKSIDVRYMELSLFYQALCIFFKDDDLNAYLALRGGGIGALNPMDNPTSFVVVGNGVYGSKTLRATQCVPIWANYMRIPDLDIVQIYSERLAKLDRTIEINSENARMSKMVVASENTRLTMTNINRQIEEGNNAISVKGNPQDVGAIQAFDMGVNPDSYEKLHILRTRIWNECMGLLGIENANQDKKERLVAAEVDANNDQTSMMRFVNLNSRQLAAKKISEMIGRTVTVSYNSEIEAMAATAIPEIGAGAENE